MPADTSLLDLLLEVEALDRIPRTGYLLRGVATPESVTEHSWHVLFLVWTLAGSVPEVDLAHALELALVHDLAELRIGDLPRTAGRYFPAGCKQIAEAAALAEILAPAPERASELFAEYQAARTPAARLVKACDKLQLMIKVAVYESWGATGLAEFWDNPDNFPEVGIPAVEALVDELRERRRRRLGLEE